MLYDEITMQNNFFKEIHQQFLFGRLRDNYIFKALCALLLHTRFERGDIYKLLFGSIGEITR